MKNAFTKDLGLALLRVVPSLMMMSHGLPKLQKMLSGDFAFANPLGIGEAPSLFLAVVGEFIAPIFIILGFKTRFATIPVIITMLVAVFIVHGADPFGKKELPFLYAIVFIVIALVGPGKFGIDKK
ncbi:DoxX family protein [Croceivirga radicis]|uniref:DoxX family protein n=1 Tax=Croceivirga radicis TaxID=1929488 RepID=A0A1V6LSX3_9FLAO|nr:DoxX family protein [Croceivirga radicis]OQD43275.1 DoxX family protein [Croceivirga radicis]